MVEQKVTEAWGGVVSEVLSTNTPAASPTLTLTTLTDQQFAFRLTGKPGTNYIVQAATSLTALEWMSLCTTRVPFDFVETNVAVFPRHCYRGLLAP
jgi:hypothetical protein